MQRNVGGFERGQLWSSSGTRVRSRRRTVAIGLSEARRAGARIDPEAPPLPLTRPADRMMLPGPVRTNP